MGKWIVFLLVLIVVLLVVLLGIVVYNQLASTNTSSTGNVIKEISQEAGIVTSAMDRCADDFFSCLLNCPTSTMGKNYISKRCVSSCVDTFKNRCSLLSELDLSSGRRNKVTCLNSCNTARDTILAGGLLDQIDKSCVYNCLN